MPNEIKSKEYSTPFYMRQPHPAPRHSINGYVESICASDAQNRINQWNDSPEGYRYQLDHVDLIRTENEDSDTSCNPWPDSRCSWELKGVGIYNLYYKKL